jgi:hypothetical protein
MKRSNDSDEDNEVTDPSVPPADGTSPIDRLPLDMFYQILMAPGQSIRDISRLCRVDRRFRAACTREYVWRKLYFLKVVKSPGLAAMKEPEAARYINAELMQTPEGVQWTAQRGFAQTPYVLLMAFAWLDTVLNETDSALIGGADYTTAKRIIWGHRERRQGLITQLRSLHGRIGLFAYSRQSKTLLELGFTLVLGLNHDWEARSLIPFTHYVSSFCRLLQLGFIPAIVTSSGVHKPAIFTQSCLSCGSPAAAVQCGADCGAAHYCDQECANAHWEEHEKQCH